MLLSLSLFSLLFASAVSDSNVRTIHDANDLIAFSNDVNNGTNYSGSTVILDADIVFTKELSEQFMHIGVFETGKYFNGTFDGQGHIISNLKINSTLPSVGLFSYSRGVTIRNVVVDTTCSITGTYVGPKYFKCIGGITGFCDGNYKECIIENTVNMANVTYLDSGSSPWCVFIGGIAGEYDPYGYDMYIKNCVNYGTIYLEGSYNYASVGGIVASCDDDGGHNKRRYYQGCANYGDIIHNGTAGSNTYIGGVVGMNIAGNLIENCLSAGTITSPNTKYVGAIVGIRYDDVNNIVNCSWTSSMDKYNASGSGNADNITGTSLIELTAETVDEMNRNAGYGKWLYNPSGAAVTFNINGVETVSFTSQVILLPVLADDDDDDGGSGREFCGWFTDNVCETLLDPLQVSGVTTLYGGWGYTATFDYGNASNTTSKRVVYGQLYGKLPEPGEKEGDGGYTFSGWFADRTTYRNGITAESIVNITEDTTFYACWTSAYVEIVFGSKDLGEKDVVDYVSNRTKGGFVIERFEVGEDGNLVVIVRFTDAQEAMNFVTVIGTEGDPLVEEAGFVSKYFLSYSSSINIPFLYYIFSFFSFFF